MNDRPASVSSPFIARPVGTSLLAFALLIAGVLGYRGLPVSSLPAVEFPTITVTTTLPGASPETMASLVTAPLERQLGQIPALAGMTSTSTFGLSQVTLTFGLGRGIDGAAQDVGAAITAAGSALPRGLPYPPTYAKVNPADAPVLTLALTSPTVPLRQLADLADTLVAVRLAEVPGVGRVTVLGGLKPAVRVRANLEALAARGLSLADLRAAIASANVSAPKGALDGPDQSYTVNANDGLSSAGDYGGIVVAMRGAAPVMLRDVARVEPGFEDERAGASFDGRPAVVLDVRRQPGANTVATVDTLRAALPGLARAMPADARLDVVADRTGSIRASVWDVQLTLALSVALVILVVLLFLRTASATLIAGTALPLSLIATFAVMRAAGFSLDNLSLMALTIGTGFVVDDAIVMIENIARHRELGEDAETAAYRGAAEIGFTVISLTASLLAVFIPLLFMSGLVGRMFREFALTLSAAVVVSAVVSLTLTPMMCARLLRHAPEGTRPRGLLARTAGWFGDGLARGYEVSLAAVLRARGLTLLVTALTVAVTVALYAGMPKSFLPPQDTGLIALVVRGDGDVSHAETTRLAGEASAAVRALPEVEAVVAVTGTGAAPTPNAAALTVVLAPHGARSRDAEAVAREIEARLARVPGLTAFARPLQDVQLATRAGLAPYQYTLTGPSNAAVRAAGLAVMARLRDDPAFRGVASVEEDEGLAARIEVDRVRAGQFGVTLQGVSDALNDAFSQRQVSTIYDQANQYRVVLDAEPGQRADPAAASALRVPGTGGAQVPLASIASVTRGTMPLAVSRQEQFPAFTIGFDLAPGTALDEAVARVGTAKAAVAAGEAVAGSFSGEAEEFRASLGNQPLLILAAVVAIYIVLGVLYESTVHPLTILSTLPSAGIGALLALRLAGQPLTVIGVIGIVLLMGIVKKNAILMIDFALVAERERGLTPEAAIVEAARLRFRPITMTTLAALFGALPLALATGPGAELRMPLGVAIVGGLTLSQLLTLYTTPVVYLALDGVKRRVVRWTGASPATLRDELVS